jgi:hypothetical protein
VLGASAPSASGQSYVSSDPDPWAKAAQQLWRRANGGLAVFDACRQRLKHEIENVDTPRFAEYSVIRYWYNPTQGYTLGTELKGRTDDGTLVSWEFVCDTDLRGRTHVSHNWWTVSNPYGLY